MCVRELRGICESLILFVRCGKNAWQENAFDIKKHADVSEEDKIKDALCRIFARESPHAEAKG